MRWIAILFAPLVLGGCVAAGAAAGGAAGAAAASDDEDVQDLEYWLKTNDTTTRIGEAMRNRELTEGMSKTQVKLFMGTKGRYDTLPTERENIDDGTRWIYEPELDQYSRIVIDFVDEEVTSIERQEVEEEECLNPRECGQ